ncbi:hypothetical protein SLEP1_g25160 [Rubroshorea leprosula]|uniref:Protein SDA1 n=1 Tax=Rubroshorea leprosula TaxID=152421 RepID=A0AAV5JHU2_9ROSI|nr:hypothetical protein SLEP1_g25160 [Rubroshorea leprosula]
MNKKCKNEMKNKALQIVLFKLLKVLQKDEARAKRSILTLRYVSYTEDRIMVAALLFLLEYEKIEDDDASDASSSEDEMTQSPQAHHEGTTASKRKKKANLQRGIHSMKRQQHMSSESSTSIYYSPPRHLKDAVFAEKLFSNLRTCCEWFEVNAFLVRMMMLKVIARTIGLHRLILLDFYHFLQKYVQTHQKEITSLLAAAVQACHGLSFIAGYEDQGRPIDPKARPKAYGEANVFTNVPGAELLLQHHNKKDDTEDGDNDGDEIVAVSSDDDHDESENFASSDDKQENQLHGNDNRSEDDDDEGDVVGEDDDEEELEVKEDEEHETNNNAIEDSGQELTKSTARKRKISDFDVQLIAADPSLRALKMLAEAKLGQPSSDATDAILSNEDSRGSKN